MLAPRLVCEGFHKPDEDTELDSSERRELTQQVHRSTGAYELVLSPLILGVIGFGIDRLLGTLPVLTVTFVVAGLVGASAKLYFSYKAEMEMHEAQGPWARNEQAAPLTTPADDLGAGGPWPRA